MEDEIMYGRVATVTFRQLRGGCRELNLTFVIKQASVDSSWSLQVLGPNGLSIKRDNFVSSSEAQEYCKKLVVFLREVGT